MSGLADLDVDAAVSVRTIDGEFLPVNDKLIDILYTADPVNAFTSSGVCIGSEVTAVDGASGCEVDIADPDTNVDGNFEFCDTVDVAKRVYYAWAGSAGADFDKDSTTFSEVTVTTDPGVDTVEWSTS